MPENLNLHDYTTWMSAQADDAEIPAWKRLDIVIRKWAALSGHEKDMELYEKMRQEWQ